jgi:hypothetical protein
MTQSVTDKTPIPVTTWRRHNDPPGLWVAVVISSVILHLPLVWLLASSGLSIARRTFSSRPIPIDIVTVLPSKQTSQNKPIAVVPPKAQLKPKPVEVKPKTTITQPTVEKQEEPSIAQAPQPDAITFTNLDDIKKANLSPKVKKTPSNPPTKPKQTSSTQAPPKKPTINQEKRRQNQIAQQQRTEEQRRQNQIAQQQRTEEQRRQNQIAQQQRTEEQRRQNRIAQQQRIEEQRRQNQIAQQQRIEEQRRQNQIAQQQRIEEQRRQNQIAQQQRTEEQRRQNQIAQQQRTEEQRRQNQIAQQRSEEQRRQNQIAQQRSEEQRRQNQIAQQRSEEQRRQNQIAQQQRIEEQRRQNQIAQQQRIEEQRRLDQIAKSQGIPRSSTPVDVDKDPLTPGTTANSDATGGFLTASLFVKPQQVQQDLNSTPGNILKIPPQLSQKTKTPNKLPLLDDKDKQRVTKSVKCGVLLSIDANGNIFSPKEGFSGIRANSDTPGMQDICQRYAEEYFKQNKENIEFTAGQDIDGKFAAGQILTDITIQPAGAR